MKINASLLIEIQQAYPIIFVYTRRSPLYGTESTFTLLRRILPSPIYQPTIPSTFLFPFSLPIPANACPSFRSAYLHIPIASGSSKVKKPGAHLNGITLSFDPYGWISQLREPASIYIYREKPFTVCQSCTNVFFFSFFMRMPPECNRYFLQMVLASVESAVCSFHLTDIQIYFTDTKVGVFFWFGRCKIMDLMIFDFHGKWMLFEKNTGVYHSNSSIILKGQKGRFSRAALSGQYLASYKTVIRIVGPSSLITISIYSGSCPGLHPVGYPATNPGPAGTLFRDLSQDLPAQ